MHNTLRKALDHNRKTQNPTLDLGRLGLQGNEPELEALKDFAWVETLIFSNEWREFDVEKNTWTEHRSQNKGKPNQLAYLPALSPQTKQFICAGDWNDAFEISDFSFLQALKGLTTLDLTENQISDISFLQELKGLTTLDLSINQISDISFLQELKGLTTLDLSENQISDISFLQELKGLTTLYLSSNQISDISFLQELKGLTTLYLNNNQISDFSFLQELKGLTTLHLRGNQISDISFLQELKGLTTLDLYNNEISDISFLQALKGLTTLNISGNKISDFSFLQELKGLTTLDLSFNQISDISFLQELKGLTTLNLTRNKISDISFLQALKGLTTLDLRFNQISDISLDFLSNFPKLGSLYLAVNPIQNIPKEVFDKVTENVLPEVLAYLRALEEDEAIPNDEVKLVWLGNTTAGKSSIFRYLQEREYVAGGGSTHGIKNVLWTPAGKDFNVNVWDFGGQEFYHATHRLFLSQNAVNVVVFEEQTNTNGELATVIHLYENNAIIEKEMPLEHFHFTYWLDSLQHWAGKADALLVQNKLDCAQIVPIADQEKQAYHIGEEAIFRVSVAKTHAQERAFVRKFEDFEEALLGLLEKVKATYPFSKKQMEIKHRLRALGKTQYFFETYEDYVAFCEEIRPKISEAHEGEASMLEVFTDYAQKIGVLLHFPQASSKVFINPEWLIDIFYRVLDYGVLQNKGEFIADERLASLCEAKGIAPQEAIALMKQFELIFEIEKKGKTLFVAPQYLPTQCTNEEAFEMALEGKDMRHVFTLQYPKFMPKSNFLRFIAKYGSQSKNYLFWKSGLVFNLPTQPSLQNGRRENSPLQNGEGQGVRSVFAECNPTERKIIIQIQDADQALAYQLFQKLYEIDSNESLEVCVDEKAGFVNFAELQKRHQKGRQDVEWAGKDFEVKDFVFLFGETKENLTFVPEPNIHPNMNENIQKALKHLDRAEYAKYFSEMDAVMKNEAVSAQKALYHTHKAKFMAGDVDFRFTDMLKIFTSNIDGILNDEASPNIEPPPFPPPPTTVPVFLTVFANPHDDLGNLKKEEKAVQKNLLDLTGKGIIKYAPSPNTSKSDFFDFVESYQNQVVAFHYAGHANGEVLVLEDGEVYFKNLARELFRRNKETLKFVFLNGCSTRDHVKVLFELGASVVIATSVNIGDNKATEFAIRFYHYIAKGNDIENAYLSASDFVQADVEQTRFRNFGKITRFTEFTGSENDTTEFPWGLYVQEGVDIKNVKLF